VVYLTLTPETHSVTDAALPTSATRTINSKASTLHLFLIPQPQQQTMPFDAVSPDTLQSSPDVLVLDIRPYLAYSSSRIINALPFAAPSTLLKRPRFPLSRLQTNLSESARIRFSAWPEAPQIVVYDADSTSIPDSCNIQGLLRKFSAEGFRGRLSWLEGGFQAVCRDRPDLVDTSPPSPQSEQPLEEACPTLCTSQLPISAFSLASTTASASSAPAPAQKHLHSGGSDGVLTATSRVFSGALLTRTNPYPACNSFFDTIHQNLELTHGITDRIPLRLPSRVRRRISDLPFKWLRDIAHRAAPLNAEEDAGVDPADVAEGAEALAMQFYRIELAEQRRMMGVMDHHSKQSRQLVDTADDPAEIGSCYPFSITAGVEKGAKNRYITSLLIRKQPSYRISSLSLQISSHLALRTCAGPPALQASGRSGRRLHQRLFRAASGH
jgi:tyrosine-protein phosphatase 2/3